MSETPIAVVADEIQARISMNRSTLQQYHSGYSTSEVSCYMHRSAGRHARGYLCSTSSSGLESTPNGQEPRIVEHARSGELMATLLSIPQTRFIEESMPTKIADLTVHDIRFPTSRALDGSDAMNPAPDYSATYVVLKTNSPEGLAGHGLTFTIGRGNEISVAAVKSLAPLVVGASLEEIFADMGGFWRHVTTGDSQIRWLGPEKGVIHLPPPRLLMVSGIYGQSPKGSRSGSCWLT
jgi:hypothetical protein